MLSLMDNCKNISNERTHGREQENIVKKNEGLKAMFGCVTRSKVDCRKQLTLVIYTA